MQVFSLYIWNDKIHHYPLKEYLKIRKILVLTKSVYKKIKKDFLVFRKWADILQPRGRKQIIFKKAKIEQALKKAKNEYTKAYEPSNISHLQNSKFWQWRRVKDWWRELNKENSYNKIIKEKKHIVR